MDCHIFKAFDKYPERRPVSDESLAQFQRERGLKLPDTYVALLRMQNGGTFRHNMLLPEDVDEDDACGEETEVRGLFGIGEERHSVCDLLEVWHVEDEQQNDISDQVICFDCNGCNDLTVLDYRECGPTGEPTVQQICRCEPPWIYMHLANSFDELLERLQRGDQSFYIGWAEVGDDLGDALEELKRYTGIEAERYGLDEMRHYRLKHRLWQDDGFVGLAPNIDFAEESNEEYETIRALPAGLEFPEHPEFKWLIQCSISREKMVTLLKMLGRMHFPGEVIHEPLLELVGRVYWLYQAGDRWWKFWQWPRRAPAYWHWWFG
jgi:hypothetical protein